MTVFCVDQLIIWTLDDSVSKILIASFITTSLMTANNSRQLDSSLWNSEFYIHTSNHFPKASVKDWLTFWNEVNISRQFEVSLWHVHSIWTKGQKYSLALPVNNININRHFHNELVINMFLFLCCIEYLPMAKMYLFLLIFSLYIPPLPLL